MPKWWRAFIYLFFTDSNFEKLDINLPSESTDGVLEVKKSEEGNFVGSAFFLRIPWGAVAGESLEGVLLECFELLLGMGGLWSSDATSPAKCLGSFLQKKDF